MPLSKGHSSSYISSIGERTSKKQAPNNTSSGSSITEPREIILENQLCPGDVLMLSAAVRDLHAAHPGRFVTDLHTTARELWENNPYVTPLSKRKKGVKRLICHYPLIHRCNTAPFHFIHGFAQYLSAKLKAPFTPTTFKGDIHLSEEEKAAPSQIETLCGQDLPFWIVVAGGKDDFTIKWWSTKRYQDVINSFRGNVIFAQVGVQEHHHPPLQGVIDLRGKTTLRELVLLMHHAQGVLCPVTFAMHLCAAVETRPGHPQNRPCVVIAGGREPPHWEAYPTHQFLHTVGMLSCCSHGGCWKARTQPLGDGDEKDKEGQLCVDVVDELPHCMDMISSAHVAASVEGYFTGGVCEYASSSQWHAAVPFFSS